MNYPNPADFADIVFGYDPAKGEDKSALVFRKGPNILAVLEGEVADYVYKTICCYENRKV